MVILAQASEQVLQVLPSVPPTLTRKYEGTQETAAIRAAAQKALDHWKPGHAEFPLQHAPVDLSRNDTKSFGETHANELSTIGSSTSGRPGGITLHDPPFPTMPQPKLATSPPVSSPPLKATSLNLAPVPLPTPTISPPDNTTISHISGSDPIDPPVKFPQVTPTVAETGVPKSAGPDGPGPASGSLLDANAPENLAGSSSKTYESAEEEKRRLEREERERILRQGASTQAPKFETAEEEKRRLERERFLASNSNADPAPGSGKPDEDELPPYKEF